MTWWKRKSKSRSTTEPPPAPDEPQDVRALCEALTREADRGFPDHKAAARMIEALGELGGPEAENLLLSLLKNEESWQGIPIDIPDESDIAVATEWIAPALVEAGGADLLLRGLLDALADERARIRRYAAQELADIAWRCRFDDDDDDYGDMTVSGTGALTKRHRESLFGPLCSALTDESVEVRISALRALGDLGDVRAAEPLRRFIHAGNATRTEVTAAEEALDTLTDR